VHLYGHEAAVNNVVSCRASGRSRPATRPLFLAAVLAAILIALGSAFALDLLDRSAANVYRTTQGNVRL